MSYKKPPNRNNNNNTYYRSKVKKKTQKGAGSFSDRSRKRQMSSYLRAVIVLVTFMIVVSGFIFLGIFLKGLTATDDGGPDISGTGGAETTENKGLSETPAINSTEPTSDRLDDTMTDIYEIYPNFKGAYLDITKIESEEELQNFAEKIKTKDFNAVSIDIKRTDGIIPIGIHYENAENIEAVQPALEIDAKRIVEILHQSGLYVSGVINCFNDDLAATTFPSYMLKNATTLLNWEDSDGNHWTNPYAQGMRDYITGLISVAAAAGFDEIVLSSFHFPNASSENEILYDDGGVSKYDQVKNFVYEVKAAIDQVSPQIRLGLDIPLRAMAGSPHNMTGVDAVSLSAVCNFITVNFSPSTVPSKLGIDNLPANTTKNPHDTVEALCAYFKDYPGSIRPMIQGFDGPDGTEYTENRISVQKQALFEAEINRWLLLNYNNSY